MPTLRSNAITQIGATMDFLTRLGFKAVGGEEHPHAQPYTTPVPSPIVSRRSSHDAGASGITRVYVRVNGDEDNDFSLWHDILFDTANDPVIDFDLDTKMLLEKKIYLKIGDLPLSRVPQFAISVDDEDDLRIILPALPAQLPATSFKLLDKQLALANAVGKFYFSAESELKVYHDGAWHLASFLVSGSLAFDSYYILY